MKGDIFSDINDGIPRFTEHLLRVETARFGPFTFRIGVSAETVAIALIRLEDAYQRFNGSPLSQVASQVEREVQASSVFGTNTIEGGTLTEEETATALNLDPASVKNIEQRRAVNIKTAYDLALAAARQKDWQPDLDFVRQIHAATTRELPHRFNRPGILRGNAEHSATYVGNATHDGRYKPPQFGGDVSLLLESLLQWQSELAKRKVPALIRAPLLHYYYELIHPFWDGNGRVGRVLEASLLHAAGYRYAPFALARWYLQHIDEYFSLFNICRKAAEKGADQPNMPFLRFHLQGMLESVERLHDRVNRIVGVILYKNALRQAYDAGSVNARQYTIVSQLLAAGRSLSITELGEQPWYGSLYLNRTDRTRQRDLRDLQEQKLIIQLQGKFWPACYAPAAE
jgi:hypothetical protein